MAPALDPTPDDVNPYRSPKTPGEVDAGIVRTTRIIVGVLIALMAIGGALQLSAAVLQFAFPWLKGVSEWILPRMGWVGMILGLNVIPSLAAYLRRPDPKPLRFAGAGLLAVGALNAVLILLIGVDDQNDSPYLNYVRSAWLWCVTSYWVAGVLLLALAGQHYACESTR